MLAKLLTPGLSRNPALTRGICRATRIPGCAPVNRTGYRSLQLIGFGRLIGITGVFATYSDEHEKRQNSNR